MSEIKYKYCPKCGAIMKVREDIMTASIPPMYVYDCPECRWQDYDAEKYPYTVQPEIKGVIVNYPPEPTEASYTVKFRNEAAKDILCAMLPYIQSNYEEGTINTSYWCEQAVVFADELIRQLKEEKK